MGDERDKAETMDVTRCAAFLGLTERAIRAHVARRTLPYRKLGSRVLFLRSELSAWLAGLDGCPLDEAIANLEMRRGGRDA